MDYRVESREVYQRPTAVVRSLLAASAVPTWLPEAYAEVYDYLERAGVEPAGPPFARYAFEDGEFDMEAGVPVAEPVEGEGVVEPSTLPSATVAVTRHTGSYERLDAAFDAVETWLTEHGHEQAGAHWEVYLTSPSDQPDSRLWETDLVVPYGSAEPD